MSTFHDNFIGNNGVKVVKVPLAAVDTAGGAFAWVNPEAVAVIVNKVIVDVTTVATAACKLDIGQTATSAVTLSDNLLDGIDVHSATGLLGIDDGDGSNDKAQAKVAVGNWVTGSVVSGASAGLVGNAYIHYSVA